LRFGEHSAREIERADDTEEILSAVETLTAVSAVKHVVAIAGESSVDPESATEKRVEEFLGVNSHSPEDHDGDSPSAAIGADLLGCDITAPGGDLSHGGTDWGKFGHSPAAR
jgi:hypothetical protein